LGQFALLRCSLEIEAICGRCQLVERRMRTSSITPQQTEVPR
jgi:hypothetical protein